MKNVFLILLFLQFLRCEPVNYNEGFDFYESREFTLAVFLLHQNSENARKIECSKPNSISVSAISQNCINPRVSTGLILDNTTRLEIDKDTLPPGQSFICQCGNEFKYSQWYRADIDLGNEFSNVPTSFIFASSVQTYSKNIPLVYKSDYRERDNLICLSKCPINGDAYQYQILRIR